MLAAAACGGGGSGIGGDDQQPDANGSDSGTGPTWTTLIERGWQLAPSSEAFKCIRLKIPADTYLAGFRVKSPPGTHHELLTFSSTSGQVGAYDCAGDNNEMQMLFAGGIQTDPLVFPAGVAIKLPANSYINLNLHVANFTDAAMSCTPPACSSGIEVLTIPASEVVHEAEALFVGTFDIKIAPNSVNQFEYGSCSIPEQWTLLNLWPHMHGYATHQTVKVDRGGGVIDTLLDHDYSYTDQKNYPMPGVVLNPNNTLQVECEYNNPTNFEIVYGESAVQEMCFAGFYKYPADGLPKFFCAQ